MDFTSLSATRIEARAYPYEGSDVELREFQGKQRKLKGSQQASREVFEALLATVEGDVGELSDNLINANVTFGELASLTDKDLELIGCKDDKQRQSLLEFFKLMPKQERSYTQIKDSKEAQLYNDTILKRTSSHLEAMRSALAAANYKLKIIPSEDVVVGEKNFASRFVLDALDELQRVTNEIDFQLNELDKQTKSDSVNSMKSRLTSKTFGVLLSTALIASFGFFVWKTVRNK
ncbi:uncharacterized protein LOC129939759 [Eupeodes corollae]|uniref:uncharacterized protein LOC129939759 n=1 Tax=Eupeodes corollae TaxID=290404 RepID=UPI002490D55D|nr:uncharacterized protein LOC129939759 [Eupeodes corollae]